MSKFKLGDKVKLKRNSNDSHYKLNEEYTITCVLDNGRYYDNEKGSGLGTFGDEDIITNKINMKKETKKYFIEIDLDGDMTGNTFTSLEEVKDSLSGGDIVAEVKIIKKYKVVDESIKLIEIKERKARKVSKKKK